MADTELAPWVVVAVIVLTVWRAVHGPYSDETWRSFTSWIRGRLRVLTTARRPPW